MIDACDKCMSYTKIITAVLSLSEIYVTSDGETCCSTIVCRRRAANLSHCSVLVVEAVGNLLVTECVC